MSLKEQMEKDLDLFYNTKEFASSALYKNKKIAVLPFEDFDIAQISSKSILVKSSDTHGIKEGEKITVDSTEYEVSNFSYRDDMKLERIIGLN